MQREDSDFLQAVGLIFRDKYFIKKSQRSHEFSGAYGSLLSLEGEGADEGRSKQLMHKTQTPPHLNPLRLSKGKSGRNRKQIISASFFQRDPVTCARELIGAELIWRECAGTVVEVEAYAAIDDEAAHTFTRPSARSFIERNRAGAAYVYFNYGVHWMLNVLVKGDANGFVLIRALEPRRGVKLMKKRRGVDDLHRLCSGPGKLTQAFAITGKNHEMDLCSDRRHCFVSNTPASFDVVADKRIGISRSAHLPWRFMLRGSPFVSRTPR
jgi:DNA-3-methyladenine glycosylase